MDGFKKIRVKVPATTANLGSGFDALGIALNLFNTVEMWCDANSKTSDISAVGEGAQSLPLDAANMVAQAAAMVFERNQMQPHGLHIRLINEIPPARGLGSSAAARLGGLLAANALSGGLLTDSELLAIAAREEGHPDNVAAALLGGMVVCGWNKDQLVWEKISLSNTIRIVAAVPNFELPTLRSCAALPETVRLQDAVFNLQHACLLTAALAKGDLEKVAVYMEDKIHQPYRIPLVPGALDVFAAAIGAGAKGVALSGSGPTIIALAVDQEENIGLAMMKAFLQHGITCSVRYLQPVNNGASGEWFY